MDESLNPTSSQTSDFAVPFNSTSLLDGTMPDLLDSTIPNSQQHELTKSHAELQEFICNEQVVGLLEEVLDNVEDKFEDDQVTLPQVEEQQEGSELNVSLEVAAEVVTVETTDQQETNANESENEIAEANVSAQVTVSSDENNYHLEIQQIIEPIEPVASPKVTTADDETTYFDESYLYVDQSLSKCIKRQMNESIMSLGDPMFTESRKLKHQQSLLNCSGSLNDTHSMSMAAADFSLANLVEEMEAKNRQKLSQSYEETIAKLQAEQLEYEKALAQMKSLLETERNGKEDVQKKLLTLEVNQASFQEIIKSHQETNEQLMEEKTKVEAALSKALESQQLEANEQQSLFQSYETTIANLESEKLVIKKSLAQLKTEKASVEAALSKAHENLLSEAKEKQTLSQNYEETIANLQAEKLEYDMTVTQLKSILETERNGKEVVQQKLNTLEVNQASLQEIIKSHQETNEQLMEEKTKVEAALSEARENLQSQAKEVQSLSQNYEQTIASFQAEKCAAEDKLTQLELRLQSEVSSKEDVQKKLNTLEVNQASLQETIKSLQEVNEQLVEEKTKVEAALSQARESLQSEVKERQSLSQNYEQTIANLESEKLKTEQAHTQLKSKLEAEQSDKEVAQQKLTALEANQASLQETLKSLQEGYDQLKTEKASLEAALSVARENLQSQAKEVQSLSQNYEQTIASLQAEKCAAEAKLTQLELRLQSEVSAKEAAVQKLTAAAELRQRTLQEAVNSRQERLDQLTRDKASVEEANRLLTASITQLRQVVTEQEAASRAARESLAEKGRENLELLERLRVAFLRTAKIQEFMAAVQRTCEATQEGQTRRLTESVKASQRLVGSINKLLEQVKEDSSVKAETVKKMLAIIREKLKNNISELQKHPQPPSQADSALFTSTLSSASVLTTKNPPPPTAPKPKLTTLAGRSSSKPTGQVNSENKENA